MQLYLHLELAEIAEAREEYARCWSIDPAALTPEETVQACQNWMRRRGVDIAGCHTELSMFRAEDGTNHVEVKTTIKSTMLTHTPASGLGRGTACLPCPDPVDLATPLRRLPTESERGGVVCREEAQ